MRSYTPWLLALALLTPACLPNGTNGRGGGGGGVIDDDAGSSADMDDDSNNIVVNNDNNTNNAQTKPCPNGSFVPIDEECEGSCPESIADCAVDADACVTVSFSSGSPCGTCTQTLVNTCGPSEGCCPAGCTPDNDPDCAGCGDGILDPGETCDGDCPSSASQCPTPPDACQRAVLSGSASSCTAECGVETVSQCTGGDGCCPAGCTFASDSDCDAPPGQARHGDTCIDDVSACENISSGTLCITPQDAATIDPLAGMLINPNGVCSPLDCVSTPGTCRDGTSCVQFPAILGAALSACLRPCVDANDCDAGMNCNPVDFTGADPTTYCF